MHVRLLLCPLELWAIGLDEDGPRSVSQEGTWRATQVYINLNDYDRDVEIHEREGVLKCVGSLVIASLRRALVEPGPGKRPKPKPLFCKVHVTH